MLTRPLLKFVSLHIGSNYLCKNFEMGLLALSKWKPFSSILYKASNSTHTHLQIRRAFIELLARLHLHEAPERYRGRPLTCHLSDSSAVVDPE